MSGEGKSVVHTTDGFGAEDSRIRAAYARRQANLDKSVYSHFNKGNLVRVQELEARILQLLESHDRRELRNQTILEVGCGTGYWLREFIKWGARPEGLVGVDLLADRIAQATQVCPSTVSFYCESASTLRFPDSSFDLVLQSTVFTSILNPGMKQQIALEMLRVLKPEGVILWYDAAVDNPRNADVRGINRKEIAELFPHCRIELSRITLAPPLARLIAPYSWTASQLLGRIPLLCTHLLGTIRKH